jgi:hypothetical protein
MLRKLCILTLLLASSFGMPAQAQQVKRQQFFVNDVQPNVGSRPRLGLGDNLVISGRVFDASKTFFVDMYYKPKASITFNNRAGYDLFESWIGVGQAADEGDAIIFSLSVDGEEVFRSPRMTKQDAPRRVSVPVAGHTGITLTCQRFGSGYETWASGYWAEAAFVKLVPVAPPPPPVVEREQMSVYVYSNGGINVTLNGRTLRFGYARPQIVGGRILVPMRAIFEALGATVNFDPNQSVITARRNRQEVQMRIGSREAFIDGRSIMLDVPARTIAGSTMVPLRFASEAFGITVSVQTVNS